MLVFAGLMVITLAVSPSLLHALLGIIRTSDAAALVPEGVFASMIFFGGGWLLLHFAGFAGLDSAQHAAHFKS